MKKQISECLSSIGTSDQVDNILNNFMLKTVEDSGLNIPDLYETIIAAKECLNKKFYDVPKMSYNSHLAIRKLGKQRQSKNNIETDKIERRLAHYIAQILSAYMEDISISVFSVEDEFKERDVRFLISSESNTNEPLVSMIRGVYGKVETEFVKMPKDFDIKMFASGKIMYRGKDAEKNTNIKDFEKYESWVTAILLSLPQNGNFKVTIRFVPIFETTSIVNHRRDLNRYYRQLKLYGNMNWSNNVNIGNSLNEGTDVVKGMIGVDTGGYNSSYSITLGSQNIHKEALVLSEYIENELNRITCINQEPLWAVCISVSAQDIDTIQTLTSILSGTFQEINIRLQWSKNSDFSPIIALTREIMPLMMFPTKEFSGFSFVQNEEFSLDSYNKRNGFNIGNLLWNGTQISAFEMIPKELSRHTFICGMTGSGKTNTLFKILEGVNIPFCVIEPVKGEYRALKSKYQDLQIWTMKIQDDDNTGINIMQINPFWFPVGGNLAFHIDSLKAIISSSFELTAAMPNILEQCLYNIYVKSGWDLVTSRNIYWDKLPERYLYPTFYDLCNEIEDYLNNSYFSGETLGDYKGALLSRLKSFISGYKGILLNTHNYPNYSQIMSGKNILELEGLADDSDKCLVMGTVLVQYYEYLKLHFSSDDKKLQHLLVIEEAHRIFKNTKNNKRIDNGPDPTGQLVDLLSNMMAEIRAFGEGMLIVDQSPTKIAEDAIKNSATKIVHRIDNINDIKSLQSAMLLSDDILSFASLKQGEALIRTDTMERPCKVKMICSDVKEEYNLSKSFKNEKVIYSKLTNIFIATSVMNNKKAAESIQEKVIAFLNCLVINGMTLWYDLTANLFSDILDVLRTNKVLDIVDYKINILHEIISISLKNIYNTQSKLDSGMIHMFALRLLDFFYEKKEGKYIKLKAIEIFQRYLQKNIIEIVKTYNLQYVGEETHKKLCEIAEIDETEIFSFIVTCYIKDILPAIEYGGVDVDADRLICGFLKNCILCTLQEEIINKYYTVFEKLSVYLKSLNNPMQGERN